MPDHFYCTNYHGELAPQGGYWVEHNMGFVFTSQQPDTVPIWRFFNPETGDHLYHQNFLGGSALNAGYQRECIGWHMYPKQRAGTTALYKWWSNDLQDHFYCTDPNGENVHAHTYIAEGVLGYVCTSQEPGTVPLRRWVKQKRYDLVDNQFLQAWCYNRSTGEMRMTRLNLDHCVWLDRDRVRAKWAPQDLEDPGDDDLSPRFSEGVATGDYELKLGNDGKLHTRYTKSAFLTFDREDYIDLEKCLRRSPNGMIEFVHPNQRGRRLEWMKAVNEGLQQGLPQSEGHEKAVDAASKTLFNYLTRRPQDLENSVMDFMRGTYVEDGKLIRPGFDP